jgi:hypothetical protein
VFKPSAIAASAALAALVVLTLTAAPTEAMAQGQRTLLQQLRELIRPNPPQAVGGSRGGGGLNVCLVTPLFQQDPGGIAIAEVAMERPTLLAAQPLNEVRLLRNGRIVWQQLASSSQAIEGPIPWPLEPLNPGETLLLRLRPRGAGGSDFADIQLIAANQVEQQRTQGLLADQRSRLDVIESEARAGRAARASELLFAPLDPTPPAITKLRAALIEQACGITAAVP